MNSAQNQSEGTGSAQARPVQLQQRKCLVAAGPALGCWFCCESRRGEGLATKMRNKRIGTSGLLNQYSALAPPSHVAKDYDAKDGMPYDVGASKASAVAGAQCDAQSRAFGATSSIAPKAICLRPRRRATSRTTASPMPAATIGASTVRLRFDRTSCAPSITR